MTPIRSAPLSSAARLAALGTVWLALLWPPASMAQQAYAPVDRIVAVVNDGVILASELGQEVRAALEQMRASGTPLPAREVLHTQVLERLILARLQVQEAERVGLRVDENTLNGALQSIAQQNNVTLAQFRDLLERDGFNFLTFRERVRAQLLITQLHQREVSARVSVPEREVENFIANEALRGGDEPELRVSHILFALPDGASPEQIAAARGRAEGVLTRLREGADFRELAVTFSDARDALEGGDLGWRKVSSLPPAFAEALRGLEDGQHSEILRTASGWHIIQLTGQRSERRVVVEQTQARHILVRPDELASEQDVVHRLEQLRERVVQGDDFGALARAHSDDRSSALRDGDLGWLNPGDTVPDFERRMDALAPGEVSQPFRTQFGWHVVQVVARRQHDGTDAVQRARALEAIRARKAEEELQAWLRQLRDEAYVDVRLDELY